MSIKDAIRNDAILGRMKKATYDTDANDIVDEAETTVPGGHTHPNADLTQVPGAGIDTDATAHAASDGSGHGDVATNTAWIGRGIIWSSIPDGSLPIRAGSAWGSQVRAGIDTDATAHASSDGSSHSDVASNTSHSSNTANPHSTDIENLGSGTLAELNDAISDATLMDTVDEDDMSSDSSTLVPTQQSVKAYIDSSGGGNPTGPFVLDLSGTHDFTAGATDPTSGLVPVGDYAAFDTLEIGSGVLTFDSGTGHVADLAVYLYVPMPARLRMIYSSQIQIMCEWDWSTFTAHAHSQRFGLASVIPGGAAEHGLYAVANYSSNHRFRMLEQNDTASDWGNYRTYANEMNRKRAVVYLPHNAISKVARMELYDVTAGAWQNDTTVTIASWFGTDAAGADDPYLGLILTVKTGGQFAGTFRYGSISLS
jgi:hypothetical protein